MKSDNEVLQLFDRIRRAQQDGKYSPHKPLLILLALARVQRGAPRLADFAEIEVPLKQLLTEFGPSSAAKSRHYPFWHLWTDGNGAIWDLHGPRELLSRSAGSTPNLGELRSLHVQGGFSAEMQEALERSPGLLKRAAIQILEAYFPETLRADIASALALDITVPTIQASGGGEPSYSELKGKRRDPTFRDRILRAYEYRCCVCGFGLRIGNMTAGLEAAHIQWHQAGGPDIEPNGLALCALHHKLFDLGVFTVDPLELRVLYSQHAIPDTGSETSSMSRHGQTLRRPQHPDYMPGPEYLAWNRRFVFKTPPRHTD